MAVVVLLRFLLAERLHHTFLFCIRKHQVHAGGKGCLVLIITDDVESISHQTPYYVPFLLRINIALNPELQLIIKKKGEGILEVPIFLVPSMDHQQGTNKNSPRLRRCGRLAYTTSC